MADEQIKFVLSVDDQGSMTIKKFGDTVDDTTKKMSGLGAMSIIAANQFMELAKKAFDAGEKIMAVAKEYAEYGHRIEENSRMLGMSTKSYQEWSFAAAASGASSENFMNSMKFLSRAISEAETGSGRGAKALSALGISVKDAQGNVKGFDALLPEIIAKMGQFADGPNKMAVGMALFGRGFLSIMPMLERGMPAIDEYRKKAEEVGAVLGEDTVKNLAEAKRSFEEFGIAMKTLYADILAPLISGLGKLVEALLKVREAFHITEEEKAKWQPTGGATGGFYGAWATPAPPPKPALPGAEYGYEKPVALPELGPLEDMKKVTEERLRLEKELLSVGTQTLSSRIQILEIERQMEVEKIKQDEAEKALIPLVNQVYDAKIKQLKFDEEIKHTIEEQGLAAQMLLAGEKTDEENRKMFDEYAKKDAAERLANQAKEIELEAKLQDQRAKNAAALKSAQIEASASQGFITPGAAALKNIDIQQDSISQQVETLKDANKQIEDEVANASKYNLAEKDVIARQLTEKENLIKITELEGQSATLEAQRAKYVSETAPAYEGITRGLREYSTSMGTTYEQMEGLTKNVVSDIGNAFGDMWNNIFNKSETFSQKMRKLFENLGQEIINALWKALVVNPIMQQISGTLGGTTGGGGGMGLGGIIKMIGSLFGGGGGSPSAVGGMGEIMGMLAEGGMTKALLSHYPIRSYAYGGVATTPQLGVFGEGGGEGEAFIPLKGGKVPVESGDKGPSHTVVNYNNIIDEQSFVRKYSRVIDQINQRSMYDVKRFNKPSSRVPS
jgi:hypothetical protein